MIKNGQQNGKEKAPSPRAFAIGTGVVLQTAGILFVVGAFCCWGLSSLVEKPAKVPETRWMDYLAGDRLPAAALTLGIVVALVGGLGMLAAGVGLQGERPSSGWIASVVTGVTAALYWVLCGVLLVKVGSVVGAIATATLGAVMSCLFALSWRSASVLRRFPPPADQSVVTEEFLEEHRRAREERRRKSGF